MSSTLPRKDLVRAGAAGISLRAADDGGMPTLHGHFAKFNEWTTINSSREGHFMERFQPGSFSKTLVEQKAQLRCLFQHGRDPLCGDKPLGPFEQLHEDGDVGAYYAVPMLETDYCRELIPGLRAGLYGASFRFAVMKEHVEDYPARTAVNPKGIPQRTVTEAKLYELGPVTFPAYAGSTAGLRSLTDLLDDVDAMQRATPLLLDESRLNRARVFLNRGVELEPENRSVEQTEHSYNNVVAYVGRTVWAMHPESLVTILNIVQERREGKRPSAAEIRARIGQPSETREAAEPESKIAVIPVTGTIAPRMQLMGNVSSAGTSIESLQEDFADAVADQNVSAIVFDIDSPGGSVDLVPEFAAQILAARGTKPIVAVANTFAASAAYWIAAACEEISVSPSGQVGSIGVYTSHTDQSGADKMDGLKTTLISAGKYKVEGNPYEPLSKEAQSEMQRRIDAYYDMFIGAVADGRGTTDEDVLENFGQGRMSMAQDAVDAGMADHVETFAQTIARLEEATGDEPVVIEPEDDGSDEPGLLGEHSETEPAPAASEGDALPHADAETTPPHVTDGSRGAGKPERRTPLIGVDTTEPWRL